MWIKSSAVAVVLSALLAFSPAFADELRLKPDRPDTYVVVRGDTLWDISAMFLEDPWRWPEIWHINPEIANPHLIYPGDRLTLVYRDGKPYLQLERGPSAGQPVVKLSPHARATKLSGAIPTVPTGVLNQFISQPRVLTQEEIDQAGYILAAESAHLISGTGAKIYARDLEMQSSENFSVFRIGNPYYAHGTTELLGYEAIHVSDAQLLQEGDPSTLIISDSKRETLVGDRLLTVNDEDVDEHFIPHPPEEEIEGHIISILDGVSRAGQYQSVVIDLGTRNGLERGHVLAVYQSGIRVQDHRAISEADRWVTLPDERAGVVMIYRAFEKASYALIMRGIKDMRVGDKVINP